MSFFTVSIIIVRSHHLYCWVVFDFMIEFVYPVVYHNPSFPGLSLVFGYCEAAIQVCIYSSMYPFVDGSFYFSWVNV